MVYVLNIDGQPLMPTARHGKIRRLLRDKKAKILKCCPFTIQLLYKTPDITQDITLGVDAGYVENVQGETFELTGVEWDSKNKVELHRRLALKFDMDLPETHLTNGEFIIVTVLPSRKDPDRGVAEEIARLGQAIEITNDKGKEKIVFLGKLHAKRWNKNHTILSFSFHGIQNVDGGSVAAMVIGQSERVYNGKTYQQFRMTKYMLPRKRPAQQNRN